MPARVYHCSWDRTIVQVSHAPQTAPPCPLCRGLMLEGMPTGDGIYVPMSEKAQLGFYRRLMEEGPRR